MIHPEQRDIPSGTAASPRGLGSILTAVAVLAAGLVLSVVGWRNAEQLTEHLAHEHFEARATEISMAIGDRLSTYEMALRGGQAMFTAVGHPSRDQWRDFVGKLNVLQNYPGTQGIGYAQVVQPEELNRHQQTIRAQGFPDYAIRPEGTRPVYTSIIYLEPFDERNRKAFGYDMFSEPVRRAAMERARDTGNIIASGKVTLMQETDKTVQAGFLLYLACYAPKTPVFTVEERRAALHGYVYSPFRMNNLMRGILGKSIPGLGLDIHDGDAPSDDGLMFCSETQEGHQAVSRSPLFESRRSFIVFERPWTLVFRSLPDFEAEVDRTVPRMVLLGGISISLLLALIAHALLTTRAKALSMAEAMTVELRESEEKTRLILESTGEPIYGIDTNGLCTFCNPASLRALGYARPEDLLGRNMHDLIHHSYADGSAFPVEQCRIFRAFQVGEGTRVDDEVLWRADGTSFQAEYWSYPQKIDGQITGAVVVFQDITERKRAEADSAKLAGLVNAASQVSIIATDPQGIITVFNPGAENMLGYSAAEMVGIRTPATIHLEAEVLAHGQRLSEQLNHPVEGFEAIVAKARGGGHEMRQWTYVHKDGRHIPVELVVTAICDRANNTLGFLGIGVDISARVLAEKALRRSKDRFQKLAQLSPVGIFETDAQGNCLFVNKRWQEFSGLSLQQALGRGWVEVIHPDDVTAVFTEWVEAAETNRDFNLEYRFQTPEGRITWLMGNATAYRDAAGEMLGFFGTVMDIGKRIKAEVALRESRAMLFSVLDSAVDPIFTADVQGRILTANPAACATFGYSLDELVGQNLNMLMPEPFHSEHAAYLERYASTRAASIIGGGGREVRGQRKDGTTLPFDISVSEFLNRGERQFTGILRDISERVRARESLEAAHAELAARQKIVDADMEAAAEIQRSLLPKQGTCSLGIEADFRFMPSTTIGGDIFNLVCLGSEHTGLYMVDVSGHGVPAALVSVSVAQELSLSGDVLMDKSTDEPRRPDDVLRLLDVAFPMERFDKFFSMFYMVYEPRSGKLSYCNAGHPPPMLLRAGGGVENLEEGGTLVGLGMGDTYAQGEVTVSDGDTLLVYTDGVTELEDPAGEQFGPEQLEALLQISHNASPEQVLQAITGKLQAHADGRSPDDDISLICVRFNKP